MYVKKTDTIYDLWEIPDKHKGVWVSGKYTVPVIIPQLRHGRYYHWDAIECEGKITDFWDLLEFIDAIRQRRDFGAKRYEELADRRWNTLEKRPVIEGYGVHGMVNLSEYAKKRKINLRVLRKTASKAGITIEDNAIFGLINHTSTHRPMILEEDLPALEKCLAEAGVLK